MSELCEHETFKDICGICHRDNLLTALRAENERLRAALRDVIRVADRKTVAFDAARSALGDTHE